MFEYLILGALVFIIVGVFMVLSKQRPANNDIKSELNEHHRRILQDFNDSLNKTTDRFNKLVSEEFKYNRDVLENLKVSQQEIINQLKAEVVEKLNQALQNQGKIQQESIQSSLKNTTLQLLASIESLTKSVDTRLEEITGKVHERLEEGFKKTNETFLSVMERLATIDEAQKKIDGLTTNVVSLQELLGDKRSRGAYGELQLESLVKNILPPDSFSFQHSFKNGSRADCVLFLPEPTGTVAVDSKFPMENYQKMFDSSLSEQEKIKAEKQFKIDVRKHITDISTKYIIPDETSDGAVMFVPAEAVFAEIHAYHPELIQDSLNHKVWVVSPTTLMAVLNTARAVLKDVETRKQVHIIKAELGKLGKEFERFDQRMKKLADNIRMAHENAQDVHITSQKISRRFSQIEKVELQDDPNELLEFEDSLLEKSEQKKDD